MRSNHGNSFKLTLETLGDRLAPSVSLMNGDIWIDSGAGHDVVTVSRVNVPGNGFVQPVDVYRVVENGAHTNIPVSWVTGGNVGFNGNGGNDRFENQTWLGALGSGGAGADTLIGGPAADYMHGGLGSDTLSGGGGTDQLFGNTDVDFVSDVSTNSLSGGDGMDFLNGSGGADIIDGGRGEDYLYGRGGNDQLNAAAGVTDFSYNYLSGGDGADSLNGGSGFDYMDGGIGNDSLIGGAGNDGLFGGSADGRKTLTGGSGADRFLIPAGPNGVADDSIADQAAADARLVFRDSPALSGETFTGQTGTFSFAAGNWADRDIEEADVALGNLHRHIGNTRLLETAGGGEITFLAVGVQAPGNSFEVGGWNNDDGEIALVNPAGMAPVKIQRITYHEIGHNWDEGTENAYADAFRTHSGWIERDNAPAGFTASSGDGDKWYYRTSAGGTFARDYGKTNPNEDMATTWEAYFIYAYHGEVSDKVLTAHAGKWESIDLLFADLRESA